MSTGDAKSQWVEIDTITPWSDNPRIYVDEDVDALAAIIQKHGMDVPIVVRKANREIIKGHRRRLACRRLGMSKVLIIEKDVDERTAHLIALEDNKVYELGKWDEAKVAAQLQDYTLGEAALAGWGPEELAEMAAALKDESELPPVMEQSPDQVAEPEMPEAPEDANAVTKPGDVWTLGRHRLVCGSSVEGKVVEAALRGRAVDLVTTDPPYGVDYESRGRAMKYEKSGRDDRHDAIAGDGIDDDALDVLLRGSLGNARAASKDGAVWYVCAPAGPASLVFGSLLAEWDIYRQLIIWAKDHFVFGRSDFHYRHELIFYGWTPGAAHHPPPERTYDSVWEFARPKVSAEHPTMKPLPLFVQMQELSSKRGDVVFDPFLGSGTSLLAAEQTGRICYGTELKPGYCDVIVERWQRLTGGKAERAKATT